MAEPVLCLSTACPLKDGCERSMKRPFKSGQSYSLFAFTVEGEDVACEHRLPERASSQVLFEFGASAR